MPKYFEYFPLVEYKGKKAVNISKRTAFIQDYLRDVTLMLPYTVGEGERPEDIAYVYYGSIDYYWIILMANNMTNYYEDWVMDSLTFEKYLIKKYAEQSQKTGYDVVAWTMNEKILDNVLYYIDSDGNTISTDTIIIDYVPAHYWDQRETPEGQKFLIENFIANLEDLRPLRIYEYEQTNNENKRDIVLVNKQYMYKIIEDFRKSFDI